MKYLSLTALSLVFAYMPASSQKRQEVIVKTELLGKMRKEVYQVLKNDTSVKDGTYRFYEDNKLWADGYFKNGRKDSVWQVYGYNGVVVTRKHFTDGKRTGNWDFFDRKGQPEWTYDFSVGKATYYNSSTADTSSLYYLAETGNWVKGRLDINPLPVNGSGEWITYLNGHLRYPQAAQDNEEQGTVLVGIVVNESGEATDYSILKSASPSLDEEAMLMVKNFHYEFIPAEKNGRKVTAKYRAPITFKMETVR